jgi:GTP cyclohydrolase I
MEKQHAEKNLEEEKVTSDLTASHIDGFGLSWSPSGAVTRMEESEAEREKRINTIANSVREILQCLGEDPDREGIKKTPLRYAKALLYLTRGMIR